ncbi:winged helix DNA-binding domain-containing protein [Litorihabitans aurantiacus]|uniref:Winged helix DNA-binding domain-containing protein n=1 Tax=Litorihabitans aurantiacus TaxID=1930061 RepID=A0AA37XHV3_9MICO|nr:winged helix DNA-binding domain-containing protein [Litorihabitans aurantiacus]GMA32885.1 hypothetical protein GCM10025875_28770 [Litorihabitans aurantiacus]
MTREIPDAERRARLGRRHALAAPVATAEEAARAVVALHGTDPAATALAAWARTDAPTVADDLRRALDVDRSLVRILTLRRTLFAVPTDEAPAFLAATATSVAAVQRRRTHALLVEGGVTNEPEAWLARADAVGLAFVAGASEPFTTKDLAAADPLLAARMRFTRGTDTAEQGVASRLLTLWSCEGTVVRASVVGGWTSSQVRWSAPHAWLGRDIAPGVVGTTTAAGSLHVARRYVERYGPVTPDDLQWWTGWTRTHTRATLAALAEAGATVPVTTAAGDAVVSADDAGPVAAPPPWVALLPALDPTTMGWRHRDFHLGAHGPRLFDRNGNAGPTVWADGRVVGGWAVREDGTVGVELLEEVDAATAARLEERRTELERVLAGTVVKPRARGWTPTEHRIRATS